MHRRAHRRLPLRQRAVPRRQHHVQVHAPDRRRHPHAPAAIFAAPHRRRTLPQALPRHEARCLAALPIQRATHLCTGPAVRRGALQLQRLVQRQRRQLHAVLAGSRGELHAVGGEGGGVVGEQRHGAVRPGEPEVAGPVAQQLLSAVALAVQAHVVGRGAQAAVGDAQVQAVHHPALAVGEGQARPGGQRGLPDGEGAAVEGVGGGPRGGGRVAGGEVAGHGVDQRGRAVEVRVHGEDDGRGGGDVLAV